MAKINKIRRKKYSNNREHIFNFNHIIVSYVQTAIGEMFFYNICFIINVIFLTSDFKLLSFS